MDEAFAVGMRSRRGAADECSAAQPSNHSVDGAEDAGAATAASASAAAGAAAAAGVTPATALLRPPRRRPQRAPLAGLAGADAVWDSPAARRLWVPVDQVGNLVAVWLYVAFMLLHARAHALAGPGAGMDSGMTGLGTVRTFPGLASHVASLAAATVHLLWCTFAPETHTWRRRSALTALQRLLHLTQLHRITSDPQAAAKLGVLLEATTGDRAPLAGAWRACLQCSLVRRGAGEWRREGGRGARCACLPGGAATTVDRARGRTDRRDRCTGPGADAWQPAARALHRAVLLALAMTECGRGHDCTSGHCMSTRAHTTAVAFAPHQDVRPLLSAQGPSTETPRTPSAFCSLDAQLPNPGPMDSTHMHPTPPCLRACAQALIPLYAAPLFFLSLPLALPFHAASAALLVSFSGTAARVLDSPALAPGMAQLRSHACSTMLWLLGADGAREAGVGGGAGATGITPLAQRINNRWLVTWVQLYVGVLLPFMVMHFPGWESYIWAVCERAQRARAAGPGGGGRTGICAGGAQAVLAVVTFVLPAAVGAGVLLGIVLCFVL